MGLFLHWLVLTVALLKTSDDNSEHFPLEVVNTVRKNFYMDDFLNPCYRRLKPLGGFLLTRWVCNSCEVFSLVLDPREMGKWRPSPSSVFSLSSISRASQNTEIGFIAQEKLHGNACFIGYLVPTSVSNLNLQHIATSCPWFNSSVFDPLDRILPFILTTNTFFNTFAESG